MTYSKVGEIKVIPAIYSEFSTVAFPLNGGFSANLSAYDRGAKLCQLSGSLCTVSEKWINKQDVSSEIHCLLSESDTLTLFLFLRYCSHSIKMPNISLNIPPKVRFSDTD